MGTIAEGFASFYTERYLDIYHPDLGGAKPNASKKDDELSNYASFRVHLRHAIRRSISTTIGITISRPFAGILIA